MSSSPYQTYLAERLQSARGLGWSMPAGSPSQSKGSGEGWAKRCVSGIAAVRWARFALPNLLLRWLLSGTK